MREEKDGGEENGKKEISLSPSRAHACARKRRRGGKGEKSLSPLPHARERTCVGERGDKRENKGKKERRKNAEEREKWTSRERI